MAATSAAETPRLSRNPRRSSAMARPLDAPRHASATAHSRDFRISALRRRRCEPAFVGRDAHGCPAERPLVTRLLLPLEAVCPPPAEGSESTETTGTSVVGARDLRGGRGGAWPERAWPRPTRRARPEQLRPIRSRVPPRPPSGRASTPRGAPRRPSRWRGSAGEVAGRGCRGRASRPARRPRRFWAGAEAAGWASGAAEALQRGVRRGLPAEDLRSPEGRPAGRSWCQGRTLPVGRAARQGGDRGARSREGEPRCGRRRRRTRRGACSCR